MLSEQGRRIRLWLLQNQKHARKPATTQEARANFEAFARQKAVPPGTKIEQTDAGGVPAEWVSGSPAAMACVIFYLHGGGYTMGSPESSRAMASQLSTVSGCRVLVVDYRLAPEHTFPAAVEDAVVAYRWLINGGAEPGRTVVVGDSSGGGLALSLLVTLRDQETALPSGAVLLSPWTDLAGTGKSVTTRAQADPWLTADMNKRSAALYAAGQDLRHPLLSPLYADLHCLPPLLIHVGEDEILHDDATRVAALAKAAGVDVTLEIWEGMWHAWHHFAPQLPEGQRALEGVGAFIRRKTS